MVDARTKTYCAMLTTGVCDLPARIAALEAQLAERVKVKPLDPDMPAQQLRMHLGEMTAQEMRTARAAIRLANSSLEATPPAPKVTEAMVDAGARAIAKAWGEDWECCCTERKGLDCDCGDAMTDDRYDSYDERLSRDDCRIAARAALTAAQEAGKP